MSPLLEELRAQVKRVWQGAAAVAFDEGLLPLLRPVPPYDQPAFLTPAAIAATVIGLAILSGVALGALAALMIALLGLHLLLTEVLGISFAIRPLGA